MITVTDFTTFCPLLITSFTTGATTALVIYYYTPSIYTVYFCIEKNIWNSIYENKKLIERDKQNGFYYVGQENVYKDLNDFTEKMKKCGLMHKIDADYLPTPETPVICDKYNENNPIPSKKIKDFY